MRVRENLGAAVPQNEVDTIFLFWSYETYENCYEFSPEKFRKLWVLSLMGPEKSCKIPGKCPARFPGKKTQDKLARRASVGSYGKENGIMFLFLL